MTKKADFNAEEWSLLLEAAPLAGMFVSVAGRGGTIREGLSMGRAYKEARKRHEGSELVDEIVSAQPQLDPQRFNSADRVRSEGLQRIRAATELVESKATNEEAEGYKRFILALADTVAHAKKEGGVLGIGGKQVSEQERAAIEEIALTLSTEPPPADR
ncbi:MAG: hypothetical protein K0S15_1219 [Solirubrobacterales bacterium]|jgi:hypothetical protein|nr:hypothetical protein [Solirubrobacterales bacterium]